MLIYVDDDIIITSNHIFGVCHIINGLSNRFSVKDLGTLHFFLGVEVLRTTNGIFLSQQKYIMDLLHDVHMQDSTSFPTPMCSTKNFSTSKSDSSVDISKYR